MPSKAKPAEVAQPAQENADKIADTRPGSGWKLCPSCKKWIKGPNTPVCYACHKPFPVPPSKSKGKPASKPYSSFGDALETLGLVREFAKENGGYEKAGEAVGRIATLIDACGGIADLEAALSELKGWEQGK